MVDYAQNGLGVPQTQASLLGTIHGLCQMAGLLAIMPLSDYLGRRTTMILTDSVVTACLIGLVTLGGSWPALCLLVGGMAFFFGVTFAIYGASAGDYFPRNLMGTIVGLWTPFYGSGAMAAHWVAGALRDYTGGYFHAFGVCALAALLSLVLMLTVKKPAARPSYS